MTRLNDDARWLVNELAKNEAKIKALGKPQLASSSIEGGKIEEYDRDGNLSQIIGEQHDGTHTSATVGGPVPPEPVVPSVTVGFGSAEVRANGKFAGDALSPMDFSHFSVHASRVEVFSPDNESKRADIAGEAGDLAVILLDPGAWTFGLVAVSKAGKWSALSETVTVEVPDFPEVQDIQDALDELDEKYDGVITEAGNLGTRLSQAEQDITATESGLADAGTRLDDAFGQIGAVDSKATAAAGVASSAQSKADTAKSAADQAAADALAASGLAAGKGKVLVQSAAPAAADRNVVTLWIDTTGGANTPKRWTTGTTWVAVTDKTATDAATAAANAKSAADAAALAALAAQQAAGTAQSTADNALTMAGTKARVYYSTSTPSGTASTNDLWRQVDATKNVIGEWYWDNGWVKTLVSSQAISNLDVGKLTVGTGIISDLVAEHIAGRSARFIQLDVSQLVAVTGTMSEAVITKLFTDVVMSRKITTGMLAVGDFENLAPSLATQPDAWELSGGMAIASSALDETGQRLRVVANTASAFAYGPFKDARPGESFFAEAMVYRSADSTGTAYLRMYWYDNLGANISITNFQQTNTGNAVLLRGAVTAPAGTARARLAVAKAAGSGDTGFYAMVGRRRFGGEVVIDGSLKSVKLDVEDLAANTGFIADLTARIVKSDMFVGKEFIGGVFTGSTFQTSILPDQGMKLDSAGLRAYGPEGGEPVAEIRPDGGTVYQVSDPATGEVLGGIGSDGGISGSSLAVSGEARIDGVLVVGGDPLTGNHGSGEYGPVVNGRDLLGKSFADYIDGHPGVTDGNAWMTALPFGVIARGYRSIADWSISAAEREVMELSFDCSSARAYRLNIAPIGAYAQPGTYVHLRVYRTSDGSRPTLDSPRYFSTAVRTSGQAFSAPHHMHALGGVFYDGGAGGRVRYLISIEAVGGEATIHNSGLSGVMRVWIEDIGLLADDTSLERNGSRANGSGAPAPAPPAPKPDPVTSYADTISATWWQAYIGGGGQATGSAYSGAAAQGRTPYYTPNGVMRGLIGIPSQASRLSGATVKKIEVYVYAKAWHASAGGTACIGVHGHASKPGSWSSTTDDVKRQKMKRPEGRWITLPSSVHAGFKSGSLRGISFLPPSSSTSTEYYGIFTGNKTKFRFTYTK